MTFKLVRTFRALRGILNIMAVGIAIFLPVSAGADVRSNKEQPRWSVEVKGGNFYPDIERWEDFYGDKKTWQVAGAVAYKLIRQMEIGIEGGMIRDRGRAGAPINTAFFGTPILAGQVTYDLWPLNLFVLFRGVLHEEQVVVPYVGGGYTRMFYRLSTEGQSSVKGAVNGYHGRAGLQLLLDNADRRAANNLLRDYGILHTYLFFEAQVIKADADTISGGTVNLGGTSYLGGLLFEF